MSHGWLKIKIDDVVAGTARIDASGKVEINLHPAHGDVLWAYFESGFIEGLSLKPILVSAVQAHHNDLHRALVEVDASHVRPPRNEGHNYTS